MEQSNSDKYFVPNISDICIGYEAEMQSWSTGDFCKITITHLDVIDILKYFDHFKLRVPYLTIEQVNKEGWLLDYSTHVTPGISFYKENYNLWIIDNIIWIRTHNNETLFKGECKDINFFRKLIKSLNI